jgi:hypothetical protein
MQLLIVSGYYQCLQNWPVSNQLVDGGSGEGEGGEG